MIMLVSIPKLLQETSATVCDEDQEFSLRPDIAERNRYKTHYPCMNANDQTYKILVTVLVFVSCNTTEFLDSDNFITTEDDEEYINATKIKVRA